ncbi:CATRA system-associated protein [Kitasatospora sp. NPDC058965]|uniref:CATRA system-associated protein n=1 Tax=Kitasatospora sp. NPDC058965 TaxID=3346682 RepID=UPI0036C291A5
MPDTPSADATAVARRAVTLLTDLQQWSMPPARWARAEAALAAVGLATDPYDEPALDRALARLEAAGQQRRSTRVGETPTGAQPPIPAPEAVRVRATVLLAALSLAPKGPRGPRGPKGRLAGGH